VFISICLPRSWPGTRIRALVVVTIVILVLRWVPGDTLPLGLGGWLGSWLTAGSV
jgi:hypothetical protein